MTSRLLSARLRTRIHERLNDLDSDLLAPRWVLDMTQAEVFRAIEVVCRDRRILDSHAGANDEHEICPLDDDPSPCSDVQRLASAYGVSEVAPEPEVYEEASAATYLYLGRGGDGLDPQAVLERFQRALDELG